MLRRVFTPTLLAGTFLLSLMNPGTARADELFVSRVGSVPGTNDRITMLDTNTLVETDFLTSANGLNYPTGIAFDSSGNLIVVNKGDNSIMRISPDGSSVTYLVGPGSTYLDNPQGVVIDAAGNVYVANLGNDTIAKFTSGGAGSFYVTPGNPTLVNGPVGLAIDTAGNIYVANADDTIGKVTAANTGSTFASAIPGTAFMNGLQYDPLTSTLYASLVQTGSTPAAIVKYDSSGNGTLFASGGDLDTPAGMALDSSGRLYVANFNNVERFTTGGVGSIVSPDQGDVPGFLAIRLTAIPEPSVVAQASVLLAICLCAGLRTRLKARTAA